MTILIKMTILLTISINMKPKLLAIVLPLAMNGHDVFVPKSEQDAVRSSNSSANDKAWVANVAIVLEKGEIDTKCVITWGGGGVLLKSVCESVKL